MDSKPSRTLRPITDEDRVFLKKVFDSAWQRALAGSNWPPDVQQQVLAHQFEAQDSSYRKDYPDASYDVIEIDGTPAGRIYVDRRKDEICLMEMSLLPKYRNQKIGTALIEELLEEAAKTGKTVVLHVEHWNPEARRLYERLGFEMEEDIGTHWRMRWSPESGSAS